MTKKQTDKLMNVLLGIASFAILLGALFKLQHYPNPAPVRILSRDKYSFSFRNSR